MRSLLIFLLFLLPGFTPTLAKSSASKTEWQQVGDRDGILVYKREIPGSPIIAFRGTGVVDAPIARIAAILFDPKRAPEWADDLEESRVVRWISEPIEFIEYNHVGTPIVIKDRDFVSRVIVNIDAAAGTMHVKYEAADAPEVPKSKYVRGDLTGSGFILKSIENGTKTFLDGEVQADPKGAIPKWLVNLFQQNWPYNTIQAIRRQARKPDIVEHPYFRAVFEKTSQAAVAQ